MEWRYSRKVWSLLGRMKWTRLVVKSRLTSSRHSRLSSQYGTRWFTLWLGASLTMLTKLLASDCSTSRTMEEKATSGLRCGLNLTAKSPNRWTNSKSIWRLRMCKVWLTAMAHRHQTGRLTPTIPLSGLKASAIMSRARIREPAEIEATEETVVTETVAVTERTEAQGVTLRRSRDRPDND